MDSRIGLDYIVENREYISKLGAALDTSNAIVKKQVFELLSALCAYNADGYARAIETLEFYKNLKKQRYRFKIVINELEKSSGNIEYQVALLAFINCVIISAATLQERIRIRNEFIGLKVLPLLNNLRKVAQSVGDIIVQLDVFEEQRECDEAQSLQGPDGINLSSHLDVFYAILRQVADTPQEVPFLSILQHLLRIDPKEPVSDIIWDTTEKLVHRATLLENHEDSVRLLRTPSVQKFTCPHCRSHDATSPSRKQSGVPNSPHSSSAAQQQQHNGPLSPTITTQTTAMHKPSNNAPPPPPPPIPITTQPTTGGAAPLPPPPPPPMLIANKGNGPPAPPPIPGAPPPPLPPSQLSANGTHPARPRTPEPGGLCDPLAVLLPQQDTPAPKAKMKTINWGKIPPNKVIGKQNIWTIVASNHQDSPMADIDWNEMEGLFCLQSTSAQGSPKLGREGSASSSGYDTLDRKSKKESTEITLLDGKRSLNVNIFLKQFRSSNEDIIQLIKNGEHEDIGAEKLRGLLKILPEVDELDMLKSFNGDWKRLGNAEKFLLQLLEVPNYKLRIESMLLKEEFAANVSYLDPCINAMIYAGDDLINNTKLQELLYMVLVAGNFLNSGGYAGNAAGVKLSSLQKLTDIRANKPGMNLIHFVALQAEKRNPELLKFTTQLNALENASKTTSEQINNEINTLDGRIRKIKRQIEQPATDEDIKEQMHEFLLRAESEVAVLQAGMKEVEVMRLKLSEFFCDDPGTFRLEECFKIFHNFCDKFKQAVKENERRQQLEEQATLRRKQREEQLARRARQLGQAGTPVSDTEHPFLTDPTFDPRASPALSRRRMGSFNNGCDISNSFIRMESNDGMSPDITPNGSLRRRRSRVLAEEDDLMEFLRTSGHEHNSRERKAYGSLDRSWARRARSGSSSRKRPELLNIDFGVDRERASSPAPHLQQQERPSPVTPATTPTTSSGTTTQQHHAHEDAKPRISREWRQKIETWLQSNENDEKQNEEYKRKRRLVNANRRSLENDAENERKLDPLPEEKIMPSTPAPTPTTTNPESTNNKANNYQRVYPDWKPSKTLEQTDVVGTMQAIADANTALGKSQRNHSNTSAHNGYENGEQSAAHVTTAEELRQYRRQRSQEQNDKHGSPQLQSIAEEDRRKSYIQKLGERDVSDRLQIYIRRPSSNNVNEVVKDNNNTEQAMSKSVGAATVSITKVNDNAEQPKSPSPVAISNHDDTFANLLNHHKSHNEAVTTASTQQSRKEIDADNIETPPVTRRVLSAPTTGPNTTIVTVSMTDKPTAATTTSATKVKADDKSGEQDVPGHFDRYSLTRRTRRYKRPTDYSSGNEELTSSRESNESGPNNIRQSASANEIRRLQQQPSSLVEEKKKEKTIHKLEKVGRHISSINQEDVREAIRNLKSPTGTPERIWSPPREITPGNAGTKTATTTLTNGNTTLKVHAHHHELNDEGFEETQSLVSDTPSHGKEESTNSSCNEANETAPLKTKSSAKHKQNSITTMTSRLADRLHNAQRMRTPSQQREQNQGIKSQSHNTHTGAATVKRSASNPAGAAAAANKAVRMPNGQLIQTPARHSIRKSAQDTTPQISPSHHAASGKRDVERSSSRNSLRSSRSSINSGASTNTVVRRMPHGTILVQKSSVTSPLHTASVDSSPSKRPLAAQNTRAYARTGGVPASRSSSSGSSVGHSVVVVRKSNPNRSPSSVATLGSTSFKENQTQSGSSSSRANAARSAVLVKTAMAQLPQNSSRAQGGGSSSGSAQRSNSSVRGVSSFMRPTTASTTKRNK